MTLTMLRGQMRDHADVMQLLNSRIEWLSSNGLDQWRNRDFSKQMCINLADGLTWCLMDDDQIVGTATISTYADSDFWSPEEAKRPALYMSKMATIVGRSNDKLGVQLVGWLMSHAQSFGISTIRWDAWRTNERLHRYYRSIGAKHIRTVFPESRRSGALFEISYMACDSGVGTVDLESGSFEVPQQSRYTMRVNSDDSAADVVEVLNFGHHFSELNMPSPTVEFETVPSPLKTSCRDGHLATIYNPGPGWRLSKFFNHAITDWPTLSQLQSGHPYQLRHETVNGQCELRVVGYLPRL